jgi:parvulin-like peptidyl-prolyl isomerase
MIKKNIFLLIPVLLIVSCGTKSDTDTGVVAQVNDAVMTNDELEEAISNAPSPDIKMALKRKLMEKWIEDEIFYQAAMEDGVTLTHYEETLVQNYRKRLIIEKYLKKYINKNYRVLDREIEDYYDMNKREFIWDETYVHIIHLVLENREQVIDKEIRSSKNLMEVIQKNFFDQKSTRERPIGDLGYVKLADLPDDLSRQIKNMKTGMIRGPIKTSLGYHYIQLLDLQKPGQTKDMELVRDEIVHRLQIQKRKNEIEDLKGKLRENYTIQTDLSKLNQQ